MTTTLLLDLDDTLLRNDIDAFIPAYLKKLSGFLANVVDPQLMSSALLSATQAMIVNTRPECTLKDIFDEAFYPAMGISEQQLAQTLKDFYNNIFPSLRQYTMPLPAAISMVEQAFERDYEVAVATNPLFPLTAIEQRLDWAGLSVDKYPFALVPSYETFHFAKPNPVYFTEFLGQLGWEEDGVVMVGDDLVNDIEPSCQLGITAIWIDNSHKSQSIEPSPNHRIGDIGQLLPWLDSVPHESLQPDYTSPFTMLAVLKSTPAVLQTLCDRLDKSHWNKRVFPDEWCITEILCHLRDVDTEVNLPRIKAVLTQNNPFLPGKDTDPWADQRGYIDQDCDQAFNGFLETRKTILSYLENMPKDIWQRSARHAIFGPTNLNELVNIIASHDRLHIQQIQKNLNQYKR
ncbi:MAG: DinB family protein [Anaerolineales bacterium]|nr:DinB family protein [Anaerolineales bacterium]